MADSSVAYRQLLGAIAYGTYVDHDCDACNVVTSDDLDCDDAGTCDGDHQIDCGFCDDDQEIANDDACLDYVIWTAETYYDRDHDVDLGSIQ